MVVAKLKNFTIILLEGLKKTKNIITDTVRQPYSKRRLYSYNKDKYMTSVQVN
jgi:hypothetical protein